MVGRPPAELLECDIEALKAAIASKGMTQAGLARSAQVAESTVNQLLRTSGQRTSVRFSTAALIAAALDVRVGDLFACRRQTIGA